MTDSARRADAGDTERRAAVAEQAARAGGRVAFETFRADLPIETKEGKTDYVTQADRDAQKRVGEVIGEAFPGEPIVGEEDEVGDANPRREAVPEEGPAWIVDPIDGTNNYVREIPVWATSVAAVVDGEPVAAATVLPALDDIYTSGPDWVERNDESIEVSSHTDPERFTVVPTFWWEFDAREEYARAGRAIVERFGDLRRWGCAQAALAMLADGGFEGVLTNRHTNPWDTVAGVHLVREAGGVVTDLHGDRWHHDSEGLVASNGTRHEIVLEAAREIVE